jgi:predicted extracellular nuclease
MNCHFNAMKRLCILILFSSLSTPILAQKEAMIAFWNVENLYDTIDDPAVKDEEFLPSAKNAWTSQRYNTKLKNTAEVILKLNKGIGPDILGMAEVENRFVLEELTTKTDLKKQKYGIVHYDSPDQRGIDVALIYKTKSFSVLSSTSVPVVLPVGPKDSATPRPTRDILVVRGILNKKDTICILVNHWPSRLGGVEQSDPKRMAAAQTVFRICDSLKVLYPNGEIISMGDYNDEPTDRSMMELTLSSKGDGHYIQKDRVAPFINMMDSIKASGDGTHYYKKEKSCLDQILVSPSLQAKKSYYVTQAFIFKPDWIFAEVYKNDGLSPKRTWAGSRYIGGYSDHLPVYVILKYQK